MTREGVDGAGVLLQAAATRTGTATSRARVRERIMGSKGYTRECSGQCASLGAHAVGLFASLARLSRPLARPLGVSSCCVVSLDVAPNAAARVAHVRSKFTPHIQHALEHHEG